MTHANMQGAGGVQRPAMGGIPEVSARLDEIVVWARRERQPAGYLAAVYRHVTDSMAEGIAAGRFEDGPRMERLNVLAGWRARCSGSYGSVSAAPSRTSWTRSRDDRAAKPTPRPAARSCREGLRIRVLHAEVALVHAQQSHEQRDHQRTEQQSQDAEGREATEQREKHDGARHVHAAPED